METLTYRKVAPATPEVIELHPPIPPDSNASFHGKQIWIVEYTNNTKNLHKVSVVTNGLSTGCGLVQLSGITGLSNQDGYLGLKNKLEKDIIPFLKRDGAGAIICTLGDSFKNQFPFLISIGFTELSYYSNYRHGQDGKYKQKLFILTL